MIFNVNDEIRRGYENDQRYLTQGFETDAEVEQAKKCFADIVTRCGPVIAAYPSWHPLVSLKTQQNWPMTLPNENCGYKGLDHTVYFANGFVTCPYHDGQAVIDSVEALDYDKMVNVTAKRLDQPLYNSQTETILVTCEWEKGSLNFGLIPKSVAIPLFLEREIPCWRWADLAETWEAMHSYFLGQPCGNHSSPFVDQDAGETMETLWNVIIQTGMYGPIKGE